jgi:hypothetical protein
MEDLVNVKGGVEFLQACEFELLFEDEIGCVFWPPRSKAYAGHGACFDHHDCAVLAFFS